MKVLLVDPIDPSGVELLRAKAEVLECREASFDGIRRDAAEVDAVITRSRLPDDFFEHAKKIKAVMIHGTGKDLVPLKAATERGIPVANIPGLPPAGTHAPQQHAPHIGEDGPDILRELGYSPAEIDAIFARGGIRAPTPAAKAAE